MLLLKMEIHMKENFLMECYMVYYYFTIIIQIILNND